VAASSIGKQVYIISFHGVPVPASVSNWLMIDLFH
jgi:hypothetical protein